MNDHVDLRSRPPAIGVMRECVARHERDQPQGALARILGVHPLPPDTRSWYRGALGEIAVARRLASLGTEWVVIHGVPIGVRGSDIDHLVIGPSGVFTINAKRHIGARVFAGGGSVKVNGQPTQYVRNAQYEAERVGKKLSSVMGGPVRVTPMIVVVGANEVKYGTKRPTVAVLTQGDLPRWMTRQPRALSADQVARLSEASARLSTWGSALPEGLPDFEVVARFAQIDRDVARAIVRNRVWLLGALVVGASVSLVFIAQTLLAIVSSAF